MSAARAGSLCSFFAAVAFVGSSPNVL